MTPMFIIRNKMCVIISTVYYHGNNHHNNITIATTYNISYHSSIVYDSVTIRPIRPIVLMYNSQDGSHNDYYVMIEQELLPKTSHFDNHEVVFPLLAVHYIFDLEYDSTVSDIHWCFFRSLCVIWKYSPVYSTFSTRLYQSSQKCWTWNLLISLIVISLTFLLK